MSSNKCLNCGAPVFSGEIVCSYCGTEIFPVEQLNKASSVIHKYTEVEISVPVYNEDNLPIVEEDNSENDVVNQVGASFFFGVPAVASLIGLFTTPSWEPYCDSDTGRMIIRWMIVLGGPAFWYMTATVIFKKEEQKNAGCLLGIVLLAFYYIMMRYLAS
jgi:predicted nucleic acid-binding Zn ribbon protein